jgi:GNAT superfamily N-acetyltransferase
MTIERAIMKLDEVSGHILNPWRREMASQVEGPTVRTLEPWEIDRGIGPIVVAFASDPVSRWFYTDSHQYWLHMPKLVKAFGARAFEHGTAFGVDGYAASALWLPPGVTPDNEAMDVVMQDSVSAEELEAKSPFLEQMSTYHPHEPHWYLPLIGVDPTKQGQGYGSALLKHSLQYCDAEGLLAYLESTNPRNNPLYERFGFETIGLIQVDGSPPMWPMLRTPRG